MTAIRVLIADDHPIVRTGLAALLTSLEGIQVAAVAETGRQAVDKVISDRPEVAIIDLKMPDMDGFEATREIGRVAPEVAVLVLTMFDDDASVFAAMRAGARGYLVKGAEQEEIERAIRAVARGEAIFGPGVAGRVLGFLSNPPAAEGGEFPELTERERRILDLLASGLSNAAIGERLGSPAKPLPTMCPQSSPSFKSPTGPRQLSGPGTRGSERYPAGNQPFRRAGIGYFLIQRDFRPRSFRWN